jgi:hypothetical protein
MGANKMEVKALQKKFIPVQYSVCAVKMRIAPILQFNYSIIVTNSLWF